MKATSRFSWRSCTKSIGKDVSRMTKSLAYVGVLVLVVGFLLTISAVPSLNEEEADTTEIVNTLIKGIEHREQLLSSLYMIIVKELYGLPVPGAEDPKWQGNRCVLSKIRLWAAGDEFYQEESNIASSRSSDTEGLGEVSKQAFDGSDRVAYSSSPNLSVRRYSGRGGRGTRGAYITGEYGWWFDVMYYYAFEPHQVFSKAIASMGPSLERTEEVGGVKLYKLVALGESGDSYSWWVAPEKGYLILKKETVDAVLLAPTIMRSTLTWDQLEQSSEGLWFPRRVRMIKEHILPDGGSYRSSAAQFTITELLVNPEGCLNPVRFTLPLDADVLQDEEDAGVVGGDVRDLAEAVRQGKIPAWVTDKE